MRISKKNKRVEDKSIQCNDFKELPKYIIEGALRQKELRNNNEVRLMSEFNKRNITYIWQRPICSHKNKINMIVDFMIWINGRTIIVECNEGKPLTYSIERRRNIKKICEYWEYITINEAIANKRQAKEVVENIRNTFTGIEENNEKIISRIGKYTEGWREFCSKIYKKV